VNQFHPSLGRDPSVPDPSAEVLGLRQELECREQLIQQLSSELFQVMVDHPSWFLPAQGSSALSSPLGEALTSAPQQTQVLQQQLQEMETQISFYQQQISQRDAEIQKLREAAQEMGDRNQMLEKVIQELPEVYRQKFAERLAQVKAKVESLQRENRQLQAELQNIHYLAIARPHPGESGPLSVPSPGGEQLGSIPGLGDG
jgi:chromosome segregation ATPase